MKHESQQETPGKDGNRTTFFFLMCIVKYHIRKAEVVFAFFSVGNTFCNKVLMLRTFYSDDCSAVSAAREEGEEVSVSSQTHFSDIHIQFIFPD